MSNLWDHEEVHTAAHSRVYMETERRSQKAVKDNNIYQTMPQVPSFLYAWLRSFLELHKTAPPVSTKHSKHEPVEDTLDSNSIRCHLSLSLVYLSITQKSTMNAGML